MVLLSNLESSPSFLSTTQFGRHDDKMQQLDLQVFEGLLDQMVAVLIVVQKTIHVLLVLIPPSFSMTIFHFVVVVVVVVVVAGCNKAAPNVEPSMSQLIHILQERNI